MNRTLAIAAILIALPVAAFSQEPVTRTEKTAETQEPITRSEKITIKAEIVAIDREDRMVTLKGKDGYYETIYAGPEVKRFDELKVGDKVTFRYTESTVYKLRKPGEPAAPASSGEPTIDRFAEPKPRGRISTQETATVLVKSVDLNGPSVTVEGEQGRAMSFKVENKGILKNVKPGDRVEITFSTALMISVE